jgi:hypothetical protein
MIINYKVIPHEGSVVPLFGTDVICTFSANFQLAYSTSLTLMSVIDTD